ncbi:MAG: hypothetical protein IKM61_02270 [Eubacteriaceae bacterium]|nr:hypothetical protein [Eubacteriaceae bacterium]
MKRIILTILIFGLLLPSSCSMSGGEDSHVNTSPAYEVCYVNYSGSAEIYLGSLNKDKMYESRNLHLPVYKFDDLSSLSNFRKNFDGDLSFDMGYDDVPSFDGLMEKYDEEYFSENSLIACYVQSGSGSYRYGVKETYNDGENFIITVTCINSPEVGTCDMAGWLVVMSVPEDEVSSCTVFDAVMVYGSEQ